MAVSVESGAVTLSGNQQHPANLGRLCSKGAALGRVGAFIQLYREEARYLDRTVHDLERAGLDHAKRYVVSTPI